MPFFRHDFPLLRAQGVGASGRRWVALAVLLSPALGLAHGTFHDRLAALNNRLALQPDDAELHFNLAELYCEHEEPAPALTALDHAEALAPGQLPVDYLRGMCLLLAGRPAEALTALDRFVAVHPENSPARLQRARVQAALGNAAASLDNYRAALRLSPQAEPDLIQETADALAKHGLGDEAVQVIDSGLARLGPIPSLALRAIDLEVAGGRIDSALTRIAALQQSAPRPEAFMARRAAVLAQAGRPIEAGNAWRALLSHLAALPERERTSHAMSRLAEQARQALALLN